MWRGFGARLALVVAAAAVLRLVHVLTVAPHTAGIEDAFWFRNVGFNVASGKGFAIPVGSVFSPSFHLAPTATHPPLYALAIAAAIKLGIGGDTAQRSLGVLFGALTVCGVGLLGRRAGGDRLGLLAAALAAVSPLLIAADGALLSETLYGPIVAFTLLAAWWLWERPAVGRAALVGAGVGLAALTRSEAILLLPLLALPLAWRGGSAGRWMRIGAACACTAAVVAPWVVRNWSVFGRPVLSNNDGGLIAASNCHRAYHGRDLGYFVEACEPPVTGNEAEQAAKLRSLGVDYAADHAGRLTVVLPVRLLREWTLWQPFRTTAEQGRSANVQKLGVVFDYVLAPFAVLGAIALRRRGRPLLVLVVPIVLVGLTAIATYGSVRLRYPAELSLVVLAAAGLPAFRRTPERGS